MIIYFKNVLSCFVLSLLLIGIFTVVRAQEQPLETQTIHLKLMVPDTTWMLGIDEVYQVGEELWVLASVKQMRQAFGLMIISTVEDQVTIEAPHLPIKYYILGKTWGWENEESYTFIKSRTDIEPSLSQGKKLFSRSL